MVAEIVLLAVAVAAVGAELLHYLLRVRRAAPLAFGPRRTLLVLAILTPFVRVAALGAAAWGLAALQFDVPVKTHKTGEVKENEYRHLVLVLDVSPSMQLEDAGPGGKQKRAARAADLIQSFFERVQAERYKTTVVAFYTEAKPVVLDTADREVVRNILTDLPMRHAFKAGETNIFSGLEEAAKIAKPWPPNSAVVMLVTTGTPSRRPGCRRCRPRSATTWSSSGSATRPSAGRSAATCPARTCPPCGRRPPG